MTAHTKGPLVLKKLGVIAGGKVRHYTNGSGQPQLFMATGGEDVSHLEVQANAARVVLRWNAHDQLVADLKVMTEAATNLFAEYMSWNGNQAPFEQWAPVLMKQVEGMENKDASIEPTLQAAIDVMSRRQGEALPDTPL